MIWLIKKKKILVTNKYQIARISTIFFIFNKIYIIFYTLQVFTNT